MSKIIRWAEIARNNTPIRYDILSRYLKEKGLDNEITYIEVSPLEFDEKLKEALLQFDAIRLASPYGLQVMGQFQAQASEIVHLNAADSIIKKEDGQWALTSSNLEGFKKVISLHGPSINLEASVLIVGSGAAARFAIAALSQIGIKHFKISNQFQEQAKELISELKSKYFNVQFEFVPEDQLVLLPGTNAVLVNTTPLVESNSILKELYYFNFLHNDGLVIDYSFLPLTTTLINEAEEIGIKTVRGYELLGWGDIHWAKKCFNIDLDSEVYFKMLKEAGAEWEKKQQELKGNNEEQNADDKGTRF